MNKTKVEKEVDHEQERLDRVKQENAVKRAAATERVSVFAIIILTCYSSSSRKKQKLSSRKRERLKRQHDLMTRCSMLRKIQASLASMEGN